MSEKSCRIIDWLSACSTVDEGRDQLPHSPSRPTFKSSQTTKRKRKTMADDTPRAKRHAPAIATPSNSAGEETRTPIFGNNKTPSLKSSTTSSRGSSPNKRKREAEIRYSRPILKFHTRTDSTDWKQKHAAEVPLLKELLGGLASNEFEQRITPKMQLSFRKILKEIERCTECSATEEEWSDSVVLRAIRTARKLSLNQEGAEIINVKMINVWPSHLLPTNEQSSKNNTKRVDYSVGLKVGDQDEIDEIIQTVEDYTFAQANHPQLCHRALCSHLEIKTQRSTDDARYQLSVWCAAGFQKQENLWLQKYASANLPPPPNLAPIPIWLWKESQVKLWIAVMDSRNARMHVLDEKSFAIDEEDEQSLARVIGAISAVVDWGQIHYLPWFRRLIGYHNSDHG